MKERTLGDCKDLDEEIRNLIAIDCCSKTDEEKLCEEQCPDAAFNSCTKMIWAIENLCFRARDKWVLDKVRHLKRIDIKTGGDDEVTLVKEMIDFYEVVGLLGEGRG